jgi:Helix-turn-helix domain
MTTNNSITLTACEAAKVLGLAPSTLAKLQLSGNGPVYCKLGRRVVYRREDLEGVARIACCTQHLGRRGATAQEPDRATAGLRDGDSHPNPPPGEGPSELFGGGRSTVWLAQEHRAQLGQARLAAIDDRRPMLILGRELLRFLRPRGRKSGRAHLCPWRPALRATSALDGGLGRFLRSD